MPGHVIGQMKPKSAALAHQGASQSPCAGGRERALVSLDELHALSRRGLWGVLLFLALSSVTLYVSEVGLVALVPVDLKELFGEAPPAHLVHIALAVSWLSALVLILGRVTGDATPGYNWFNIGLPTAFYPLYVFSDSTGTHFPVVFAAGLVLLLVEHLSVVCFVAKAMREEKDRVRCLQH